jgi:hypothetical protein
MNLERNTDSVSRISARHSGPVHNIALSWRQAAVLTAALGVMYLVLRMAGTSGARKVAPFAREAGLIAGLYSLWQLAGELSVTGTAGAIGRAEWIERVEHDLWLPTESSVQHLVTDHPLLTQGANLYYASMHFGVLFVFLIWLFVRHRESYAAVRTTLALTTLVCLLIQLVPVAPPRLLAGYVDTAVQYGQSVYSLGFGADELSAMPSVHVAWAVLVGWYAARLSPSPWRWLGALHAGLTVLVVVATANHWWLDGIVAVLVLAACAWARAGATALAARFTGHREPAAAFVHVRRESALPDPGR